MIMFALKEVNLMAKETSIRNLLAREPRLALENNGLIPHHCSHSPRRQTSNAHWHHRQRAIELRRVGLTTPIGIIRAIP